MDHAGFTCNTDPVKLNDRHIQIQLQLETKLENDKI